MRTLIAQQRAPFAMLLDEIKDRVARQSPQLGPLLFCREASSFSDAQDAIEDFVGAVLGEALDLGNGLDSVLGPGGKFSLGLLPGGRETPAPALLIAKRSPRHCALRIEAGLTGIGEQFRRTSVLMASAAIKVRLSESPSRRTFRSNT